MTQGSCLTPDADTYALQKPYYNNFEETGSVALNVHPIIVLDYNP
jgi:hypothetical protein